MIFDLIDPLYSPSLHKKPRHRHYKSCQSRTAKMAPTVTSRERAVVSTPTRTWRHREKRLENRAWHSMIPHHKTDKTRTCEKVHLSHWTSVLQWTTSTTTSSNVNTPDFLTYTRKVTHFRLDNGNTTVAQIYIPVHGSHHQLLKEVWRLRKS